MGIVNRIANKLNYVCFRGCENNFITVVRRPKNASEVNVINPDLMYNMKAAIVLQGKLLVKDNFTVETIKLYRKLFPNAEIILSTWDDEDVSVVEEARRAGSHIVLSKLPLSGGHGSINYQRKSTKRGIEKAKELKCEYVLKTRTDQRIYSEGSLSFLYNMIINNPVTLEGTDAGRLAVISNGCFATRLYNISDMLVFGETKDVERYFSFAEDTRPMEDILENDDPVSYSMKRPGEIYISTNYIENCGFKLKWTFEDSAYYIKNLFIIVDSESLDWFWPKYSELEYRWRRYGKDSIQQITYKDWVNL